MSVICIKEVSVKFEKKGKNGWHQATVSYTDEGNGKDFVKKLMSFKNPKVFGVIQEAKEGDRFEVDVKKEGDFYEWVAIQPASADRIASGNGTRAAPAATAATRGGWETPEERAAKQVYIVKQSSISAAVALLTANGTPSVEEVIATAQQFVDYVFSNDQAPSLDASDGE